MKTYKQLESEFQIYQANIAPIT